MEETEAERRARILAELERSLAEGLPAADDAGWQYPPAPFRDDAPPPLSPGVLILLWRRRRLDGDRGGRSFRLNQARLRFARARPYIPGMQHREHWTRKLKEAEAELAAARKRSD